MLFLTTLISFLIGILAALSIPFLQKKRASEWRDTLKADLLNDQKRLFEEKEKSLKQREDHLETSLLKLKAIEKEKSELDRKKRELIGGTETEVRAKILTQLEESVRRESKEKLAALRASGEQEAKSLVFSAMHRLALPELLPISREKVVLKEESLKGRIVGPEGKNIHFLEEKLGIKLLLDIEPNLLYISSWDVEKRFFAKKVLETLLSDGKIFPKRIEEVILKTSLSFESEIQKIGEAAFFELDLPLPNPKISTILGKLAFRYSFGQNIIDHSKEVGLILGRLSAEAGLSAALGRRIGLLHDIGKALTTSDKSHALAGMEFLESFGESEAVSNGVGCHHFEIEPITIVGSLCHLADALSAGREGARLESTSTVATQKNFKGHMLSIK